MTAAIIDQIPDDFEEVAKGKTLHQLAKIYKRSQSTIVAWRRAKGIPGLKPVYNPRKPIERPPAPPGFAAAARTMTENALRIRFRAGQAMIRHWCKEQGVSPLKATRPSWGKATPAPVIDYRENSLAGKAAQYLQKFGPVVRCDAEGRLDSKGTHWLRGGRTILTDDEIMDRARRNGFDPHAGERIAA